LIAFAAVFTASNAVTLEELAQGFQEAKKSLINTVDDMVHGKTPLDMIKEELSHHPDIMAKLEMLKQLCPQARFKRDLGDNVKEACAYVKAKWPQVKEEVAKLAKEGKLQFDQHIKPYLDKAHAELKPYLEKAKDTIAPYWENIKNELGPYIQKAEEELKPYLNKVKDFVGSGLDWISSKWHAAVEEAKQG